jgi:hypothetical protein
MFPPREVWGDLHPRFRELLIKHEALLPRMEADNARLPKLTPTQIEEIRYFAWSATGGRNVSAA